MAIFLVAAISCASQLPDLRPPIEVNTVVPPSDISSDAQQMLATHNQIRRQLSLPDLRWSNQMEVYATEWALFLSNEANCDLFYRGSTGLPLHKNGIGENLYKHAATTRVDGDRSVDNIDARDVVLEWARESVDYDYGSNECGLGKSCDHYTQLVWRDSSVVGCGAASCPGKEQIWVCNYDPPGNFSKQRPY